jgi:ribose 5-phosphate isomerase B
MPKEKLILAADHGGYELKEYFKEKLSDDYEIIDKGGVGDNEDDYPLIIHDGADAISKGESKFGVFFCGSGVGASMAANRHKGVRAVLAFNEESVKMSRLHNNANVIVFGERLIDKEKALEMFHMWINTSSSDEERHTRRVDQLDQIVE